MEADHGYLESATNLVRVQVGSMKALTAALSAARRGGAVSVVGVYGTKIDNFPLGQVFDKGLRLRAGQAPVHRYIDRLMGLAQEGKIGGEEIITHRLPLAEAARGYRIFNTKREGCVKVVLRPG